MRKLLACILVVLIVNHLYAQPQQAANFEKPPTSIHEVMRRKGADTLVFFYNDRWQLVKPVCGKIFRVSRMDTVRLTFTGNFVDYYMHDSSVALKGNYTSGKKEGRFDFYFPNGQLAQTGNYAEDKKSGLWEYYYEDGSRHQILEFRETEMLVKEFWDEEGKHLVKAGNGKWFGYESAEKFMKTYGEVLNGRKHGTWKNTISFQNTTINTEKYKEGAFISGKRFSFGAGNEPYNDTSYCSIEPTPTFLAAEKFKMTPCRKEQKNNWEYATYPGGMDRFFSEIRKKLSLAGPIRYQGIVQVQTTIDTDGRMTNFKPVSNIGIETELINVLQTLGRWTPTKLNGEPRKQPKVITIEIL